MTTSKSTVVSELFCYFEEIGIGYCILAGYEHLPETFSDIDFMVSAKDFERLPRILSDFAARSGCKLVQALQHESSACYFVLAWQDGAKVCFLHPDSASDYRRNGRLWFSAESVLQDRRRLENGFFAPSPANAFAYYLVKRIDKRDLGEDPGARLLSYYSADPAGAVREIERLLPDSAEIVKTALRCGNWQEISTRIGSLANELRGQHPAETGRRRLSSLGSELFRRVQRVIFPTGMWVAFLGPDGSGKSSVIEAVAMQLAPAFRRVSRFHYRPMLIAGPGKSSGPVTNPHGKAKRSSLSSSIKMMMLLADYVLGYLLRLRPALVRSSFVIFDRYFSDVLADPKRLRYGGPRWLSRLVNWIIPQPDLLIILDAPADVLWSRKQEVAFEKLTELRQRYLEIAASSPNAVIIDASQALSKVIADAEARILLELERRTADRLKLEHGR